MNSNRISFIAFTLHIAASLSLSVGIAADKEPAFDSLFENRGNRRNVSVLDRVKEQAASLSRQASHVDKSKLDEYLASVREIEKRIARLSGQQRKAVARAQQRGTPLAAMERPDNGLPEDIREHMRLMCDMELDFRKMSESLNFDFKKRFAKDFQQVLFRDPRPDSCCIQGCWMGKNRQEQRCSLNP